MKFFSLLFLLSCTQSVIKVSETSRLPAQSEEYVACHEIKEELLIEKVDLRAMPANFATVQEYVFKNNCASCHYGPDAYMPRLDDYASTFEYLNLQTPGLSPLLLTISQGRMPPSYRMQNRNPEALRFLRKWIDEGAPQ
jgi:hypothetical protein